MSNEIISAWDALVERLEEAADNDMFTLVSDPSDVQAIEADGLPQVRLFPTRIGALEDQALNGRAGVGITGLVRIRESAEFGLYNEAKDRGLLWLLQKVANAIDRTLPDAKDLSAGGSWMRAPQWSVVDYQVTDSYLQFDVEVRLSTARFTRGSL